MAIHCVADGELLLIAQPVIVFADVPRSRNHRVSIRLCGRLMPRSALPQGRTTRYGIHPGYNYTSDTSKQVSKFSFMQLTSAYKRAIKRVR